MKNTTRHRMTGPDLKPRRALRLAHETVKTLSSSELSQAIGGSGCITTSWSTEQVQSGAC